MSSGPQGVDAQVAAGARPTFHDRTRRGLILILVLALAIRMVHFWTIAGTGFLKFPLFYEDSDMFTFWHWAQRIADGDWLGRETYHPYTEWMKQLGPLERWYEWWGGKDIFHQAPLYPYILALLMLLAPSLPWVTLAQLVLGLLQPLVMFGLTRRLLGDDRMALVSAALAALYGPFVLFQGVLLRDWALPIFEPAIILAMLRAADRRSTGSWVLAGIVMGASLLLKETTLLITSFALIWLSVQFRSAWTEAIRPFLLIAAGIVLCLLPLVARNVAVGAPPLAVSVQGPGNFIVGLSPDDSAIGQTSKPSMVARMVARKSEGNAFNALRAFLHEYRHDYRPLIRHQLRKLRGLIDPVEVADNVSYSYGTDISPLLRALPTYGLIFPVGAAGLGFLLLHRPRPRLLAAYLTAILVVQLITFVLARFRLTLVPALMLGASYLLVRAWEDFRSGRLWRLAAVLAAISAAAIIQHGPAPLADPWHDVRLIEYYEAARAYAAEGRYEQAVNEIARFRAKVEANPTQSGKTPAAAAVEGNLQLEWAEALIDQRREEEARPHLAAAEQAYAKGTPIVRSPYLLALLYLRLDERVRAQALLQEFLDRAPLDPLAGDARRRLDQLQAADAVP